MKQGNRKHQEIEAGKQKAAGERRKELGRATREKELRKGKKDEKNGKHELERLRECRSKGNSASDQKSGVTKG